MNEDSYLMSPERNLFIVSDGMGGRNAGEVASRAVVTVLPEMIERRVASPNPSQGRDVQLALREAILELSQHLWAEATSRAELKGMGATVALAWIHDPAGIAHLAHMGDSRIYLYHEGRLAQLTEDHSVVALLLRRGDISADEAHRHPARGRLSRYVGMEEEVYPDVRTVRLQDGDRLLLCTDGLTGPVPDEQIAALLLANPDPEAACQALVEAANEAGGPDNITAVVVNW